MPQQGFYSDPPGRRFAYDDDGTVVVHLTPTINEILTLNTANKEILNDEDSDTYNVYVGSFGDPYHNYPREIGLLFPESRDIIGYCESVVVITGGPAGIGAFRYSTNTTTGLDGNWTTFADPHATIGTTLAEMRNNITQLALFNIKGLRWEHKDGPDGPANNTSAISNLHVYGVKTPGVTPHRIDFCDFDGNELVRDLDFGDQPRNSTRIWRPSETWNQSSGLYLKNRSTTKLAQTVTVTYEALSSDIATYLSLSKDNITYGTSVSYSTMSPQEIVGPIYLRHNPSISANLGLKAARLQIAVGSWL